MIPARRSNAAEQTPTDTVTTRLSLLRSLQRAGPRRRFDAAATPSSSASFRLAAAASSPSAPQSTGPSRTAGPPAPRSWISPAEEEQRVSSQRRAKERRCPPSKDKDKLLAPLDLNGLPPRPPFQPLVELVGQIICRDLSSPTESILLPFVRHLTPHLRLLLFDIAASSWSLDYLAIRELLREDQDGETDLGAITETLGGLRTASEEDENDWEDDGSAERTWDGALGDMRGRLSPFANLTRLNLAYSPIKIPALRQLLVHTTSFRSVPVFPHLSTLNLAATPSLHFSEAFFDLLALLLPLRHLSLAGKTLNHPSTVPQGTFLPRLAAATPTLLSLDLSYASWPATLVKGVDWDTKWLSLKTLGMRRELVDWKGEEIGEVKRERIRRELWLMISAGRKKRRRWIDVVV